MSVRVGQLHAALIQLISAAGGSPGCRQCDRRWTHTVRARYEELLRQRPGKSQQQSSNHCIVHFWPKSYVLGQRKCANVDFIGINEADVAGWLHKFQTYGTVKFFSVILCLHACMHSVLILYASRRPCAQSVPVYTSLQRADDDPSTHTDLKTRIAH